MAQVYFITLLDEMLEPIEDFTPENTADIESAKQQAVDYMKAHQMPVGTLTFDDPITYHPARESIDIVFAEEGVRFNDYQK